MNRFRIPLHGEDDMLWGYFLLQAARGGVRVPEWVLLSIGPIVGQRLGIMPEKVTGEDLDAVINRLPPDPTPVVRQLLKAFEMDPPEPGVDCYRLAEDAAVGSFRTAVGHEDIAYDAALHVLTHYSAEDFYACMDALEDPDTWSARSAVAAMVYLLVIKNA